VQRVEEAAQTSNIRGQRDQRGQAHPPHQVRARGACACACAWRVNLQHVLRRGRPSAWHTSAPFRALSAVCCQLREPCSVACCPPEVWSRMSQSAVPDRVRGIFNPRPAPPVVTLGCRCCRAGTTQPSGSRARPRRSARTACSPSRSALAPLVQCRFSARLELACSPLTCSGG